MKDLKGIVLGILAGLPALVIVFAFGLYFFGCRTNNTCTGIALPATTPIPTLIPATLPAPKVGAEAVAAVPRCRVAAADLVAAWIDAGYPETETFSFTDIKGQTCTATFKGDVQKLFLEANLWYDGAPACTTCHNADIANNQKNMDMSSYAGILAGSNRVGEKAEKGDDILGGGDSQKALLYLMLYAPNGQTTINRPAMPLGRPANVPEKGPIISAGTPPAPTQGQ